MKEEEAQNQIIKPTDLLYELEEWLRNHHLEVWNSFCQKGGWEGWAQVNFMSHFVHKLDVITQREIPIYNDNSWAVDFIVNYNSLPLENEIHWELKCESVFQSGRDGRVHSDNKINEKVLHDIDKLRNYRSGNYTSGQALVTAIVFSPEAYKSVANIDGMQMWDIQDETGEMVLAIGYMHI
ncbi:MAG: hypothetical protein ACRBCK_11875 [Alphaproteobacteria bacterium]